MRQKLNYIRKTITYLLFGPVLQYRNLKSEIESLSDELNHLEDKKTASFHALAEVTQKFQKINQKYGYGSRLEQITTMRKVIIDQALLKKIHAIGGVRLN